VKETKAKKAAPVKDGAASKPADDRRPGEEAGRQEARAKK
jgi:hypothetical protein